MYSQKWRMYSEGIFFGDVLFSMLYLLLIQGVLSSAFWVEKEGGREGRRESGKVGVGGRRDGRGRGEGRGRERMRGEGEERREGEKDPTITGY